MSWTTESEEDGYLAASGCLTSELPRSVVLPGWDGAGSAGPGAAQLGRSIC
jgi:hypothetical protein